MDRPSASSLDLQHVRTLITSNALDSTDVEVRIHADVQLPCELECQSSTIERSTGDE